MKIKTHFYYFLLLFIILLFIILFSELYDLLYITEKLSYIE